MLEKSGHVWACHLSSTEILDMTKLLVPADGSAKLLDVLAVAELLGCSPRHIYRLADGGKMPPPVKLGTLVRWDRKRIEAWISAGCQPVDTNTESGAHHE